MLRVRYDDGATAQVPADSAVLLKRFEVEITEKQQHTEVSGDSDPVVDAARHIKMTFIAANAKDAELLALGEWRKHYGEAPRGGNEVSTRPLD
jgi:hypothetical protein